MINVIALMFLIFSRPGLKGNITLVLVLINSLITSWLAISSMSEGFEGIYGGGPVLNNIQIRVDALSAWFILLMNFTVLTGILYGKSYLNHYGSQPANLTLHYINYIINHWAMFGVFVIQNFLAFLCAWELMAISAFMLVIFNHTKIETVKAGINYLIQSHVCILFLTIGFIWVISKTGSYDFISITQYSSSVPQSVNFILFLCFFIAFGIKAGFVPFHTWLPYAHPAAPAHVSGVMSGVMIKLGIYGILRMLLLIHDSYLAIGYLILFFSIISGIYGVLLATIQHNLKKLLAYHSIENIGIIGIGIGVGAVGLGVDKSFLVFAGLGGALLHTLNHSLFKSLLFYCSGTVYQVTHTLNIEKMGGLLKTVPHTGGLFLLSALSICGLPPFNGFISEFLIYSGLFNGISGGLAEGLIFIVSVFGLAVIGGLAILCFTKAFSITFLGNLRHSFTQNVKEDFPTIFPKYLVAIFILAIGLFPQLFARAVFKPVMIFARAGEIEMTEPEIFPALQYIGLIAFALVLLSLTIFWIRRKIISQRNARMSLTWSCGYEDQSTSFQYSANSFVRSFRKLVHPLLIMNKREGVIDSIFPKPIFSGTSPYDKIESLLIDFPLRKMKGFFGSFRFLQNGNVQSYVLYGLGFIFLTLLFPVLAASIVFLMEILKQI